jgi:hypothetical protein
MNFLLSLINASDRAAVMETNNERIDRSLAFRLTPSLELDGTVTVNLGGPTAGDHVEGELWVDASLGVWRCTVAGTPGTWIQIQSAVVAAAPVGTIPNNYLITIPTSQWAQFYYDGAAWQPVFLQP